MDSLRTLQHQTRAHVPPRTLLEHVLDSAPLTSTVQEYRNVVQHGDVVGYVAIKSAALLLIHQIAVSIRHVIEIYCAIHCLDVVISSFWKLKVTEASEKYAKEFFSFYTFHHWNDLPPDFPSPQHFFYKIPNCWINSVVSV